MKIMGLRKKYFIIFMAIIFIPSIILSLSTYFLSIHILEDKISESIEDNLTYLGERIEKEMIQVEEITDFLFANEDIKRRLKSNYDQLPYSQEFYDYKRIDDTLSSFSTFNIFEYLQFIYILGKNGEQIIYGVDRSILYFDEFRLRESAQFKEMYNYKGEVISLGLQKNYVKYDDIANYVIPFYRTIIENNNYLGTMYLELSDDFFAYLFGNYNLQLDSKLILIDQNNRMVYHNKLNNIGQIYKGMTEGDLFVEYEISKYGWTLVSSIKKTELTSEYEVIKKITLLMAFLSLLSGGIIVFFITKRIVAPIKSLSNAMEQAKQGDFNIRVAYKSNDEIGLLTQNFNYMTARIQQLFKDIVIQTKRRNEAEYDALQAQINPHFLYNTLNSIRWMAIIQKADNIKNIVDVLGRLLKSISNKRQLFITFREEVEILQDYITIQDVRYKGKFDVEYDIEDKILDCRCPKFILQPIVENAIFHGIEPKEGVGTISIKIFTLGEEICIEVHDDGVGMTQKQIDEIFMKEKVIQKKKRGFNSIGIYNVHERIQMASSNKNGVSIESELGQYTKVIIKFPKSIDNCEVE